MENLIQLSVQTEGDIKINLLNICPQPAINADVNKNTQTMRKKLNKYFKFFIYPLI
ncbi:hypothetical protein TEQUI_0280 [Taylorella equigenitalis MCE9]|uniref:Uncharacterized protein n=1 Tax=Taylorella equigenitalis (strain MCE9) TaxID=937774 RepID=A0A654KFM7_TAYEM|nr:hypothetical protein TEQUI_0280 [Taylorella equigenitalis MCE9]